MRTKLPALLVAACLLGACAGGPRPDLERGWVGGDLMAVRDGNDRLGLWSPDVCYEPVVGMPEDVSARRALLVRAAHSDTPLGRAGLVPGDLVVAVDGAEPADPDAFREGMDAREPGSSVPLRVWRDGTVRDVVVTVGRERYRRLGKLSIGLGFPFWTPTFDIWPFDDGIDILGLVVAKGYSTRHDMVDVRGDYLRKVRPDAEQILPDQEQTVFRIFPITVGKGTRVVLQTAD